MKNVIDLEATMLDFLEREFTLKKYSRSASLFYYKIPIGQQMIHISFLRDEHNLDIVVDVAIRHDTLEEIFATIENTTPKNLTATIGAELGKLSGDRTIIWTISHESEVPLIGRQLLTKSREIGQGFFEANSSLEEIHNILVDDIQLGPILCSIPHIRAKKALVASYLLHRQELYNSLVDSKLQYLQSIGNANGAEFLEFAFKLKRLSKNSYTSNIR